MSKRVSYVDVGLRYELSPHYNPVARVKSGETIVLEVQDASGGQLRREGDTEKMPYGNPAVGPIYVENAEKGDSLSVLFEEIKPLEGEGATWFKDFNEWYVTGTKVMDLSSGHLPRMVMPCKIENDRVFLKHGITLPYKPMVGVIGVAPYPQLESMSTSSDPGPHGGNLDVPEVCPRSRVFLPVFHEGGLLYIGDAHATQGDGEITGTAIEMAAEVRIKLDVHKGKKIEWPRIETERELVCVTTTTGGRSLREAIVEAFLQLSTWIETEYGLNRNDAFILCGQVGTIRIGNLWTAAAKIEKAILGPTSAKR